MDVALIWIATLLLAPSGSAFLVAGPPRAPAPVALAAAKGSGGFAAKAPRRKKRATSDASGLTPEAGWVELIELDLSSLVSGGAAQAVGRSVSGKPYLVRRTAAGGVVATVVSCGRCEYPLVNSKSTQIDGVEVVECSMCGSRYDATSGDVAGQQSGAGNPFFRDFLRKKPQRPLVAFPVKELANGRVFVNIEPYRREQ